MMCICGTASCLHYIVYKSMITCEHMITTTMARNQGQNLSQLRLFSEALSIVGASTDANCRALRAHCSRPQLDG